MIKKFIKEFVDFATRGSLVDLAIGFTVGAAFTAIARSLVDDLIMPFVAVLLGSSGMVDRFWVLDAGSGSEPFVTLDAAEQVGAITVNYGLFLNNLLTLLIVALTMFFVIRALNRAENLIEEELGLADDEDRPNVRKCPYCITTISRKAARCPNCTSQLESQSQQSSS